MRRGVSVFLCNFGRKPMEMIHPMFVGIKYTGGGDIEKFHLVHRNDTYGPSNRSHSDKRPRTKMFSSCVPRYSENALNQEYGLKIVLIDGRIKSHQPIPFQFVSNQFHAVVRSEQRDRHVIRTRAVQAFAVSHDSEPRCEPLVLEVQRLHPLCDRCDGPTTTTIVDNVRHLKLKDEPAISSIDEAAKTWRISRNGANGARALRCTRAKTETPLRPK